MKTQNLDILSVVRSQRFHQPVQSMIIAWFATISSHLMPSGCINSTYCQWWSSLFSIGQLVWEEDGSLSKTTKLLLLDSLLQEVCIESGSDGSLSLSSLGMSVCLVSHNLLYSGLKKAHLKMRTKSRIKNVLCIYSLSWNFLDDQQHLESNKLDDRAFCWPPSILFGRLVENEWQRIYIESWKRFYNHPGSQFF